MSHFTTTSGDGAVRMDLEEGRFPRDAVYGAAYTFIDRCYVHLDRGAPGRLQVELRLKATTAPVASVAQAALEAMARELEEELLGQAWRQQLVEQNRALVESVATRALGGAAAPGDGGAGGSLDDLLAAGDATFDDPLGIAMSWEQKYAKKGDGDVEPRPEPAPSGGEGQS